MSGVYIKGMKMPKDCKRCPFCMLTEDWVWRCLADGSPIDFFDATGRSTKCPLVEAPDHGDLIDRDKLMEKYAEKVKPSNNSDFLRPPTWNDAVELTEIEPVVIRRDEV